jgi:hypothetical protein
MAMYDSEWWAFKETQTKNKIGNALVETFGLEGYREAYAKCQTSPRFRSLVAIAGHDTQEAWERLVVASAKLANNPKTRAKI